MNQMDIGKFIQELCKDNNMTQEELAEKNEEVIYERKNKKALQ